MKLKASHRLLIGTLVLSLALAGLATAQEAHHWGYSGDTGPDHWAEISPTCKMGHAQSPINIEHAQLKDLPPLNFAYTGSPLNIVDNGHTVQVTYAPGSTLKVGDKTYELLQFHFHHKSETAIRGKHTPLEVHLVHKDKDGNLAVVAVLLREGESNPVVTTAWTHIPAEKDKPFTSATIPVNASQLLPSDRRYYTFPGSLTTPPCSENVTWIVMVNPMTVSKGQIEKFAALYPDDERPVQPLNGRVVLESK